MNVMLARTDYFRRFWGRGFIAGQGPGIVTVGGAPAARWIHCREQITNRLIATTISAPDGTYRIEKINERLRYYLIAFDHTETHNAVIRDNIEPAIE